MVQFCRVVLGVAVLWVAVLLLPVSEEERKLPEWFKPRKGQKFGRTCLLMFCVSPFWGTVVFWRGMGVEEESGTRCIAAYEVCSA